MSCMLPSQLIVKSVYVAKLYLIVTPDEEGLQGLIGGGLTPCFGFRGSWLIVATSETAFAKAAAAQKGGKSLSTQATFGRLWGGQSRAVAVSSHLAVAGLIDQILANAEAT